MTPQEMVERALAAARGLDGAIAIATDTSRADLRWARTTLTTNGESHVVELTLIGFRATADGFATATLARSQPDEAGIDDLVAGVARALAHAPSSDDAFPLVEPHEPAPADWTAPADRTSSTALEPLAYPLGELFRASTSGGIELFGYAEHETTTTWLGSSTGLRRRHCQPSARLEITAKSHGRTRSAWWGLASDDFRDLDLSPAGSALGQGLDWQGRRVEVPAGRHRAVLTPGSIGDLMVDLWWSSSAREAVEGRSVFSAPAHQAASTGATRIGERLSARDLALSSDPHDPLIPAAPFLATSASSDAASVFDNGIAIDRVDWLRHGILEHLLAPRWLAQAHDLPVGVSADSLRMEDVAGQGSLDDVIARTDDALLVTCLWYNRLVDPQTLLLTGLTRDGVYVVKGGEVIGATTNFRFNDSPVGVLERISDAGVTQRTLPREMGDYAARVAMPPVVVEDFHFSTVSDAL